MTAGISSMLITIFSCSSSYDKEQEEKELLVEFTPEVIADLHNVFLQRAFDKSNLAITKGGDLNQQNTDEIVDFFASQPEVKNKISTDAIDEIKNMFNNFKINENSNINAADQFNNYLDHEIYNLYGIGYIDLMQHNNISTKNTSAEYNIEYLINITSNVYSASSQFWANHYKGIETKAGNTNAVIVGDAGGALWGMFFGPVGSVICGAASSLFVNNTSLMVDEQSIW